MKILLIILSLAIASPSWSAILALSTDGKYTQKATLSAAVTDADTVNKTIVVTSALTAVQSNISSATLHAWPADRALKVEKGGSIGNTTKFSLPGGVVAGMYKVFAGAGRILNMPESRPEWFGDNTSPGVSDMTTAVQRAVDSSISVILSDSYNINTQIVVLNSFTSITGITREAALILASSITASSSAPLSGLGALTVYDADNVIIQGLHIDATACATAGVDGILFWRSTYSKIVNNRVTSTTGNGIHMYDACSHALIDGNSVTGSTLDGILYHARSLYGRIVNNQVVDTGIIAIEVEGRIGSDDLDLQPCRHVTIANNIIRNSTQNNQGIMVNWSNNISITGNVLEKMDGIQFIGVANASVTGNSFDDCWNMVVIDPESFTHSIDSTNITISGNSYTLTTYPAVPRWDGACMFRSATNVDFGNNIMEVASLTGTAFNMDSTVTSVSIHNNTISGFPLISNYVNNILITDNILNTPFGAAVLTIPDATITGMKFDRNTVGHANSIAFSSATSMAVNDTSISGNTFKALDETVGIFFYKAVLSRVRVNDNRFYDTAKQPIVIDASSTAAGSNTFSNNIGVGSLLNGKAVVNVGNVF